MTEVYVRGIGDGLWLVGMLFMSFENCVFNAGYVKPNTGLSIPHLLLSAAVIGWPVWRLYA